MQTTGIIAEYNPFHNGHAYQAKQARRLTQADTVIAVMSGHFTQRGEIAITDKWHRAEAAVRSGIDLVSPVWGYHYSGRVSERASVDPA